MRKIDQTQKYPKHKVKINLSYEKNRRNYKKFDKNGSHKQKIN